MITFKIMVRWGMAFCAMALCSVGLCAESPAPQFKVVAFYTTPANESAHVSFACDANRWFPQMGAKFNFSYEATTNWNQMNAAFLSQYQVVIFLDSRPDNPAQRKAFEDYMEHGGAWMGFHFAGFALTPSEFPQNWDWYHQRFLGSGEYVGNTWPPVPAVLRVEDTQHLATKNLPATFKSAPSEWYCWKNNLRTNPDIKVLLSIDPASFPLGKSLKPNETWHSGDYPVVWTNQKYKMIYMNMGHDDLDYKASPHKQLSSTFDSESQNHLILNSLLWLGGRKGS
jgi:hypothetical protein